MISPKLLVLLQGFSKNERKNFYKFIQSPFHNENHNLVRLFEIIDQELQGKGWEINNNKQLKKERVWQKIKNIRPYQDVQMRRMSSDLTRKIYSFLAYNQFKKEPIEELIHLLPTINTPKLNKHFIGVTRQVDLIQKKSKLKNASFHFSKYKIEYQKHLNLEKNSSNFLNFQNLEQADYHLDSYYFLNKLKNYCDFLAYKNIRVKRPAIHITPHFLKDLKESPYIKEPCIKTYFYIALMLLSPDEESYFHKAKLLLEKKYVFFTQTELRNIYIYLKNYCISTKINNGKSEYFYELFNISKILLEKKINIINGIIERQDYKNIITVGLHIKEFDWTEQFIQNYTKHLPKESQDNDLNYNLAKVYFHKQEYEKVIEQLREVEYKNLSYSLGGKLMLLKTYYELKEHKPLFSLLDSYSIYLRRNKLISNKLKQQYLNILRFTRKLASLAPYDQAGLQKVKIQIDSCKALAAKKWLLEKVAEME